MFNKAFFLAFYSSARLLGYLSAADFEDSTGSARWLADPRLAVALSSRHG